MYFVLVVAIVNLAAGYLLAVYWGSANTDREEIPLERTVDSSTADDSTAPAPTHEVSDSLKPAGTGVA